MQLSTISEWLDYIGSVHKTDMDLGLDRIRAVANKLNLLPVNCPVIVVGGTNGKGSVVAGLESIYLAAGYRVGSFTSPFLFKHNEEVKVNRQLASDQDFCQAFANIEAARGGVTLTPFEYHTLAALIIFQEARPDVLILEIGLGGRLDAVNIVDADVAVITSIGIDHVEWLGNTRETIAIEKAGIFRQDKPAVCGDQDPPSTLLQAADDKQVQLYQQGRDFSFTENRESWTWQKGQETPIIFSRNHLLTQNMSTVLMAVDCMQTKLPVDEAAIRRGLHDVQIIGRMQQFEGDVIEIFDVSHNPHAAHELSRRLHERKVTGKTVAVFSMLADKDMTGTLLELRHEIAEWYVGPIINKRGAKPEQIKSAFQKAFIHNMKMFDSLLVAYQAAKKDVKPGDRIVVFGSFYVVSELLAQKTALS